MFSPRRRVIAVVLFCFIVPLVLLVTNQSLLSLTEGRLNFRVVFFSNDGTTNVSSTTFEKQLQSENDDQEKHNDEYNDDDDDDVDDGDDDDDDDDDDLSGAETEQEQAMVEKQMRAKIKQSKFLRDDDVLNQLLSALGDDGPFPVIVGGIGDSGTRGVREVLRAFRVQMLGDKYVNLQGDSQVFVQPYPVYDPKTKTWAERRASDLYTQGLHRARTLNYNVSFFSEKTWEYGRQWAGAMLWRSWNISASMKAAKGSVPFRFWGLKHPRSILVLPFLATALGDKMRFVHVFRDGKEVASGDNQQMFVQECRRYYGRDKCSRSYEKRLEFWTDLNNDAIRIAKQYLSPKSYLAVRIEDFVLGRKECFRRLANFVGIPEEDITRDMERGLNATVSHASSYLGHQVNEMTRRQLYESIRLAPSRVPSMLESLGYSLTSFKLNKSCYELPGPS